jgi:hypothetical protein
MKFWTQAQAPAGNWYDVLGTSDKVHAIDYAIYVGRDGTKARVIVRTDAVVWETP